MHPNSYSSLHLLRPHLNGRNLSFKIATQLERLLPSSSFCIVCILLFPPVHIVVFISLVLNCKEYILAPLVALYFTFFWLTGSTSRGETWATSSSDPTRPRCQTSLRLYVQEIPWLSSVILPINFGCPAKRWLDLDSNIRLPAVLWLRPTCACVSWLLK